MSRPPSLRSYFAEQKRKEREEQKRLRELQSYIKEQAKLSAAEQARLEVEGFEKGLEVLLSIHKEQGEPRDWKTLANSLPPHRPIRNSRHEFRARTRSDAHSLSEVAEKIIEEARARDLQEYEGALETFSAGVVEQERLKDFARRIIAGDEKAYTECLVEFGSFEEISALGSYVHFTVHSPKLIECKLKVNGTQVIPTEVKTLTGSGKLSVKAMPKVRFHEIYQDYVCGCVLRVAREVFALLPVGQLLVTASVDGVDGANGHTIEKPVLSVGFRREELQWLDFERLDPSDAVESFLHRGDFKKSRKSGEFESIVPLQASELSQESVSEFNLEKVLVVAGQLRTEIRRETQELGSLIPRTDHSPQLPI